eukprot:1366270-Rhodomonas_salina.2
MAVPVIAYHQIAAVSCGSSRQLQVRPRSAFHAHGHTAPYARTVPDVALKIRQRENIQMIPELLIFKVDVRHLPSTNCMIGLAEAGWRMRAHVQMIWPSQASAVSGYSGRPSRSGVAYRQFPAVGHLGFLTLLGELGSAGYRSGEWIVVPTHRTYTRTRATFHFVGQLPLASSPQLGLLMQQG